MKLQSNALEYLEDFKKIKKSLQEKRLLLDTLRVYYFLEYCSKRNSTLNNMSSVNFYNRKSHRKIQKYTIKEEIEIVLNDLNNVDIDGQGYLDITYIDTQSILYLIDKLRKEGVVLNLEEHLLTPEVINEVTQSQLKELFKNIRECLINTSNSLVIEENTNEETKEDLDIDTKTIKDIFFRNRDDIHKIEKDIKTVDNIIKVFGAHYRVEEVDRIKLRGKDIESLNDEINALEEKLSSGEIDLPTYKRNKLSIEQVLEYFKEYDKDNEIISKESEILEDIKGIYNCTTFVETDKAPSYKGNLYDGFGEVLAKGEKETPNSINFYTFDLMSVSIINDEFVRNLYYIINSYIVYNNLEPFKFSADTPQGLNTMLRKFVTQFINIADQKVSTRLLCAEFINNLKPIYEDVYQDDKQYNLELEEEDKNNQTNKDVLDTNKSKTYLEKFSDRYIKTPFFKLLDNGYLVFTPYYNKGNEESVCFENFMENNSIVKNNEKSEGTNKDWLDRYVKDCNDGSYIVTVYSIPQSYDKLFKRTLNTNENLTDSKEIYVTYTNSELNEIINSSYTSKSYKRLAELVSTELNYINNLPEQLAYYKEGEDIVKTFNHARVLLKIGNVTAKAILEVINGKYELSFYNLNNNNKVNILQKNLFECNLNLSFNGYSVKGQSFSGIEGITQTNSRLLIKEILKKYQSMYGEYTTTPLTNAWIFGKHKKEIIREYISGVQYIIKNIIDNLATSYLEQVNQSRVYKAYTQRLMEGSIDSVSKLLESGDYEVKVPSLLIEELLNYTILLTNLKGVKIDRLDVNLDECIIDTITIQDIIGYNFTKTKENSKGLYSKKEVKLKLTNKKNPKITPDKAKTAFLLTANRCIWFTRLLQGFIQLKDTLNIQDNVNEEEELEQVKKKEEDKIMLSENINIAELSPELIGGSKDYLDELELEDKDWLDSYKSYINRVVTTVLEKLDIKDRVNPTLISYAYAKAIINHSNKRNDVNVYNQLFFNRLLPAKLGKCQIPKYVNLVDMAIDTGNEFLSQVMCDVEGVSNAHSTVALKALMSAENREKEYKYELDYSKSVKGNALEYLTVTCFSNQNKVCTINAFINKVKNEFTKEELEYLISHTPNECVDKVEQIKFDCYLPSNIKYVSSNEIEEYVNSNHLANSFTSFGINSYSDYNNKEYSPTLNRDIVTLYNILNKSSIIRTLESGKAERFVVKVDRVIENLSEKQDTLSIINKALNNYNMFNEHLEVNAEDINNMLETKIRNLSTTSLEENYLIQEFLGKLCELNSKNTDVKIDYSNFKVSVTQDILEEVVESMESMESLVKLFKALKDYIPISLYVDIVSKYQALLNKVMSKYVISTNSERQKIKQAGIVFKMYLSTGNKKYLKDINMVPFEILTSDDYLPNQATLSPYSRREMLVNYNLINDTDTYVKRCNITYNNETDVPFTIVLDALIDVTSRLAELEVSDPSDEVILNICNEVSEDYSFTTSNEVTEATEQWYDLYQVYKTLPKEERFYNYVFNLYIKYMETNYYELLKNVETTIENNNMDKKFLTELPISIQRYVYTNVIEVSEKIKYNYNKKSYLRPRIVSIV